MMIQWRAMRWSVVMGAMVLAIGLAWPGSGSVFAGDGPPQRFQGLLMDRQGQTLIINERPLLLTRETRILLGNKMPASESQLVPGQWVAVEADPATSSGQRIRAIYLLPGKQNGAQMLGLFSGSE